MIDDDVNAPESCGGYDIMTTLEIAVQSDRSAQLRRDDLTALRLRRWTREEYDRMIDAGILTTQDKVQLIEGEIVEMTPQNSPHMTSLRLVDRALNRLFREGYDVRPQGPLALGPDSEPEPDLAVVVGSPRDYRDGHPTTALLVVEISDSSLRIDRMEKASLYARAGIPEYWIVNLQGLCIEVRRDPTPGVPPEDEPSYMTLRTYRTGASIAPLAMPEQSVTVDELLP
jgi:Uma2 family endonuclease